MKRYLQLNNMAMWIHLLTKIILKENNNMSKYGRKEKFYINDEDIITIRYRNFSQAPDINPEGPRYANFWVVLTEEKAMELRANDFNIRERENGDGDIELRLQIFVTNKDEWFPNIFKKCNGVKTRLDRVSMKTLDRDELERVDIAVTKGRWEFGGKTGFKAWLSDGIFEIVADKFNTDFNDVVDNGEDDFPFGDE